MKSKKKVFKYPNLFLQIKFKLKTFFPKKLIPNTLSNSSPKPKFGISHLWIMLLLLKTRKIEKKLFFLI